VAVLQTVAATLSLVAAVFFLRFHKKTRDQFFVLFAAAFVLLSAHWFVVALVHPTGETRPLFYIARAIAFLVIALAILDKNRKGR
jgi:hypothetical protein